jgi:peptidoglycan/xylan/chitin deacetylase (PgdA/CDA1 family)
MRLKFVSAIALVLLGGVTAASAAADCPGNPGALGTSRTIAVDPTEHTRIGTMQYPETLPLRDHEVVLTFDDGPLPAHTNAVLDILAAQCVKATFFMVGRMAKESPEAVRRVFNEGHSIGTHSENHPFHFGEMPAERIKSEIDDGIAHVTEALGDPSHLAPFFRIPGLRRSDQVESYLAGRGIMVWSADFLADDWRHISSTQVIRLALSRLEARGKGIFLLHDIQERTVVALPVILREMKARGYKIVHVVPASATDPKTVTDPQQWFFNSPPEQTPMAKLSAQTVRLARAIPPTPSSEIILRHRASPAFNIDAADEGQQGPPVKSVIAVGHAQLPGSWPIAAQGFNAAHPLEAKLIAEPELQSVR